MTEAEQRAAWEQMAREHQRRANEEYTNTIFEIERARQRFQISQTEINNRPKRLYSMIVAVDLHGAFSKEGKIPWHYKEDFEWFQRRTKGHICVMGRTTYDDIDQRLGDKARDSVLPERECFVVTSSPLPRANATAVSSLSEVDTILSRRDDVSQTVFMCGGERIYSEGIAYCDQLLITIVNKEVDGDRFIPREYIQKYFNVSQVFKGEKSEDLRFVVYTRK